MTSRENLVNAENQSNITIPDHWSKIKTLDMHTAGEPLRILLSGVPAIKGNTILEKRQFFSEQLDHIRKGIIYEPRGHANMYGAVLTEACSSNADLGVFFLHNEGYSTMCGHAVIALAKFVYDFGWMDIGPGKKELVIDVPAGQVFTKTLVKNGKFTGTSFINVPSFVYAANRRVQVPGIGTVKTDIAFGGAFYAICDAVELNLSLEPGCHLQLVDWGRKIKQAVVKSIKIEHPFEKDLGFLYGTIFTGKASIPGNHSRNVCIFADGELDRSPTGSGISARSAIHYATGTMKTGESYTIESILGSTMSVKIKKTARYGGYAAVVPEITGNSCYTGLHEFWFDPEDTFNQGFIFR